MPQRTARRASRFSWFRLFFESESESLDSRSDGVGSLCNLSPRDLRWTLRRDEGTVVIERSGGRGERVCDVSDSKGEVKM